MPVVGFGEFDTFAEWVNGPKFVFGEPKREWDFYLLFIPPLHAEVGTLPSWATALLSTLPLLYISGLAEKVTLPSDKFALAPTQFSTLQVLLPHGFELPSFQIQYLEDEFGLVHMFHRIWQSSIRKYFGGDQKGGGVVFEEVGKVCASVIYGGSRKEPALSGFPIPRGLEVWPAVFPVDISRDPVSKSGNNLSKVTVTYARVPVWSMEEPIYEWRGSSGEVVVPGGWSDAAKWVEKEEAKETVGGSIMAGGTRGK
jgi:hypothetical protein